MEKAILNATNWLEGCVNFLNIDLGPYKKGFTPTDKVGWIFLDFLIPDYVWSVLKNNI